MLVWIVILGTLATTTQASTMPLAGLNLITKMDHRRFLGGGGAPTESMYGCGHNCINCLIDSKACTLCLKGYFPLIVPAKKINTCSICKLSKCVLCSTRSKCKSCELGYAPDSNGLCKQTVSFLVWSTILVICTVLTPLIFFATCLVQTKFGATKAPLKYYEDLEKNYGKKNKTKKDHKHKFEDKDKDTEENDISDLDETGPVNDNLSDTEDY